MSRSRLILFDLNGTLTDSTPVGEPWEAAGLGLDVLAAAMHSAMVDTILGEYHEFAQHLESALRLLIDERSLDPGRIDAALQRAAQLPAFADADAALTSLSQAGHRLAVLTNSGAQSGRRTLEAAGIAHHFDQILGVDAVKTFKPHPDTYAYALRKLDRQPSEVTFVAAHAWDVTGAKHAGLTTALINRSNHAPPTVFPKPDQIARDLRSAAALIRS